MISDSAERKREREMKIQKKNTKKKERKICKYDSNKIEHNKTVKLPQALSVVKIFNTLLIPFPDTLIDRCSGFYTLSPPKKR